MDRIDKNELKSIDIHSFSDVMSISLWVMEYLSTESVNQFGASDIANYMTEKLGVSASRQAVHAALTSAVKKKFCHKGKSGFSIMKLGQDELSKQLYKEKFILIEPGKPFTAGMKLETIFSSMKGVLKICDPYVDIKTLNVLCGCAMGFTIELLTAQIKDEQKFKNGVFALRQEGCNIEVRKVAAGILHDRYFIDDNHIWFSGNSLNNIGKKESSIVVFGADIRKSMLPTFNSRWQSAATI